MNDLTVETLEKIKEHFKRTYDSDLEIKNLLKRLNEKNVKHADTLNYAFKVGETLNKGYKENIVIELLNEGYLPIEVAQEIIKPTLENNYDLVTNYGVKVQEQINKSLGLGLKGVKPDFNDDYLKMIIEKVSQIEGVDSIIAYLDEPIINFTQTLVDDLLHENMDFHSRLGLKPKVSRYTTGKACKWCQNLVGEYDYESVKGKGNDVWRRHKNCRCVVDYINSVGVKANVSSEFHNYNKGKKKRKTQKNP